MSKVAILGDTHFGVRQDSRIFMDHQKKFFDEVYFPTLEEQNIEYQIQLGDLMDRRQSASFYTSSFVKDVYLEESRKRNIGGDILIGNHDIYYRSSIEINSWMELFKAQYNDLFDGITSPITKEIYGVEIDLIPWICEENHDEILKFMSNSSSEYLFAHLQLSGFPMMRGINSDTGEDASLFNQYKTVFTGHFHTHSYNDNILYTGTPYELTWSDFNDPKYFFLWEPETGEIETVQNPFNLFHKVIYNDEQNDPQDYLNMNLAPYENSFVRIIVEQNNDPKYLESFIERMGRIGKPYDLQVTNTVVSYREEDIEDIEVQDPLTILMNSVEESNKERKQRIQKDIMNIHTEAMSMGAEE